MSGSSRESSSSRPERGERIAKVMARAGLCSRRDAERWIAAGRVKVNGKLLAGPAVVVTPADHVEVDGLPLPASEQTRMWRYHKPSGLVVSHRDEKGRPSVFDQLPEDMPRVISVGRLDINTEGLLLLTNDGELARQLELPATGWIRRYRVRAHGGVEAAALETLAGGVTVDGVRYGPVDASLDRQQGSNVWLTIALKEGRNREVKNICGHLGLQVTRLIRISYGPFQLGNLERGKVDEVPRKALEEQVGAVRLSGAARNSGSKRGGTQGSDSGRSIGGRRAHRRR